VSTIRLTYRIRAGGAAGEIKARHGLETKMTSAMLPKATVATAKSMALRADMLDELLKLNANIIPSLAKETY
jgi:hypothetical protein